VIRVRLSLQYPALDAGVRALLEPDPEIELKRGDAPEDADLAADVHIMTSAVFLRIADTAPVMQEGGAILVLGAEDIDMTLMWARQDAWGVLPMEVAAGELRAAVHAVASGLTVGNPHLLTSGREDRHAPGPLTEREVEILGMLSRGLANKQVAAERGISEHTVKFHVSSIYTKLNVGNRTEAVREGLRKGWIVL